jgi:biotin carboxyl carrier protein
MAKLTKKQKEVASKVEKNKVYNLDEASALVKELNYAKFDASVDLAVRLGVDPRKANQMVRGVVSLPHGTGKDVKVLALVTPDKEAEAKEAGADYVGLDEYLQKIKDGWTDVDVIVTMPAVMGKLGPLGRILGIVESISIQVGDSVKEGVVILTVKTAASVAPVTAEPTPVAAPQTSEAQSAEAAPQAAAAPAGAVEIAVPDLGVDKATVAEILMSVGDTVEKDQSIIVVESDKATVEVPSTTAGVIKAIHVALGQNVSEGVALVTIEAEGQAPAPVAQAVVQTPAKPTATRNCIAIIQNRFVFIKSTKALTANE